MPAEEKKLDLSSSDESYDTYTVGKGLPINQNGNVKEPPSVILSHWISSFFNQCHSSRKNNIKHFQINLE
ncbi:hypothetical protein L3V86_04540 [Thiotrichales bacterium 19S11-10]|nr:hypothetical protein [Thiotrichales bacterium 19S11-10]MCF6807261.1 hypothetical protein [Thiotrichales bacterium 19S9-11]MCF6811230.1 hypothetical protein [Thiotrichales bacterium 19S9-12]